jgi:enoyl-CoA hydratase/carnithine racemase
MSEAKLVGPTQFEEYSEKYKDYLAMTRRNGIIEVRLHTNGGSYVHSWEAHTAWANAWSDIGRDLENEVMIITGTDDKWVVGNPEVWKTKFMDWPKQKKLEQYHESLRLLENLIFCIDIPTIGAINGPGTHCEIGTLCDITICTEDTDFFDPHYLGGVPPGDGMMLTLQNLLGTKRAAYYGYTGKNINGKIALELGIVSEVLPREELLPRAWEIAEMIMQAPRTTRHLTHSILSRPWKKALVEDQGFHLGHIMFDMAIDEEGPIERLTKMKERLMGK